MGEQVENLSLRLLATLAQNDSFELRSFFFSILLLFIFSIYLIQPALVCSAYSNTFLKRRLFVMVEIPLLFRSGDVSNDRLFNT